MGNLLSDLLRIGLVGFIAAVGATLGAVPMTTRALQLFVALEAALLWYEPVAQVFDVPLAGIADRDVASEPWAIFFAFVTIYLIVLSLLVVLTPRRFTSWATDSQGIPVELSPGDRGVAAVASVILGVLLLGTLQIALSMCPLPDDWHGRATGHYDLGGVCLRGFGSLVGGPAVYGEPAPADGVVVDTKASEPWRDLDGDGTCTEADVFVDRDNSAGLSLDLPFVDQDGSGGRRVGLLERYAIWKWDLKEMPRLQVAPPPAPAP